MKTGRDGCAVALYLLCAGTVSAGPPGEVLVDKIGGEYREARNQLVAQGPSVAELRRVTAAAAYRADNWLALVLTEVVLMRATGHAGAYRLRNLEGLDPWHYLRQRRPEPDLTRELERMRDSAPLMVELYLKEVDDYRWSSPEAAPMERRALLEGLLSAIGRSGHPASVFFLAHVAAEGCARHTSCEPVIAALGDTGSGAAVSVLARIAKVGLEENDSDLAAAALLALGRIRHKDVWPLIEEGLAHSAADVRHAAARAAAAAGSRRYWRRAAGSGEAVREAIGAALVEMLVVEEDDGVASAALASIGRVSTPDLRARIERELTHLPQGGEVASLKAEERLREALLRFDRGSGGAGRP